MTAAAGQAAAIEDTADMPALARAGNLLVGRAAYEAAARMYPRDLIEYRHGARVIERSEAKKWGPTATAHVAISQAGALAEVQEK